MKLTLAVLATFVSIFSVPSFARRRDCAQAIISEEKFAFREINRPAAAQIAPGPVQVIGGVQYQSVAVDGEPVLFYAKSTDGVTLRWAGRASVEKLREFALRLGEPEHTELQYSNETTGVKKLFAGLPKLGALYAEIARVEGNSWKKLGSKRHRSFGLNVQRADQAPVEVAGSILSRQPSRGVRVKFAIGQLQDPEFRAAVQELIDETSDAWPLWPNLSAAVDAVASNT